MRIRINKCSDSLMWYNNRVGEIFEVLRVLKEPNGYSYWVRTACMFNTVNFVLNWDCSEVNDNE